MEKMLGRMMLAGALAVSAGLAQESATKVPRKPILLELFTSEGCSSCPPADKLLASLDEQQPFSGAELIVLSEHVDYWNHDGWVDRYSSPLFSARQNLYGELFKLDGVYTPQLVIDGVRESVGGNGPAIERNVQAALLKPKIAVMLGNALEDGKRVKLHVTSAEVPAAAGPATVYVALAENKVQSKVGGGENGGRVLTHVAVVRSLNAVGKVEAGGSFAKDVAVALPSGGAANGFRVIVFLQNDKTHQIVGATYQKFEGHKTQT
jgi:hypothetical protein